MINTDTKKDAHTTVEIHYNKHTMSLRLVERGLARVAGQSCLAGPSVLRLHPNFGYRPGWVYGREPCPESQVFFYGAAHFWSTTGCAPCGDLSPIHIVPGLITSRILTQRPVCTPRHRMGLKINRRKRKTFLHHNPGKLSRADKLNPFKFRKGKVPPIACDHVPCTGFPGRIRESGCQTRPGMR
jgi:hypothetical protein